LNRLIVDADKKVLLPDSSG